MRGKVRGEALRTQRPKKSEIAGTSKAQTLGRDPPQLGGCECVLKLLGWNLTDCDGVYGQYTIMCSVDSVRYVDG